MFINLINFLISFLLSLFLIKILLPVLSKFLLVQPNIRGSHVKPKPTGAGIVFALISLIAAFLYKKYIALISLPLAIIGFVDDFKGVNFIIRYFFQFVTGIFLIHNSNFLKFDIFDENLFFVILTYLFLSFLGTSIINFANFADGIDGLLSSCMLVTFSLSALQNSDNSFIWSLVGSLMAFLIFNWFPSKLFMGDVGSTFLGAMFFGIILYSESLKELFFLLLPISPLFSDTCIAIIRRFFAGQNIFQAHSLHLFQRLYKAGWSHSKISTLYMSASLLIGIFSYFESLNLVIFSLCMIYLLGFYLDQKVAVSFKDSLKKNF